MKKSEESEKQCINISSIADKKQIINKNLIDMQSSEINIFHKVPVSVQNKLFKYDDSNSDKYCGIDKILLVDDDINKIETFTIDNKKIKKVLHLIYYVILHLT